MDFGPRLDCSRTMLTGHESISRRSESTVQYFWVPKGADIWAFGWHNG